MELAKRTSGFWFVKMGSEFSLFILTGLLKVLLSPLSCSMILYTVHR